jgi:hypothetical protein
MNFTIRQPLKDFVKSLGSKGYDLKSMIAYEVIDANDSSFILPEKRPSIKNDF